MKENPHNLKPIPTISFISKPPIYLIQRSGRESRQYEACLVDPLVIVSVHLLFLLVGYSPEGLGDVPVRVLAANHETNLAGWIGRDGRVGVFRNWEDFTTRLLKVSNELQVEPLVLGTLRGDHTTLLESTEQKFKVRLLE